MQAIQELTLSSNHDREIRDEFTETGDKISFEFSQKLNLDEQQQETTVFDEFENEDHEEEVDDDDDFTFVCVNDGDSPIPGDKMFSDGQIRTVFPLFDQALLFDNDDVLENRLPVRPPVDKYFIESPRQPSSLSSSEPDEVDGVAAGPYCAWSKESAPEVCKKSNSTGFSKLWRFRDKVSRSNSDGRDAFVFLNGPSTSGAKTVENKAVRDESSEKKTAVKVTGGDMKAKPKVKRGKAISAHEVYLRNKGQNGDDRRKSYLPYRPELMGFFTNVNGGLSRNVHPF